MTPSNKSHLSRNSTPLSKVKMNHLYTTPQKYSTPQKIPRNSGRLNESYNEDDVIIPSNDYEDVETADYDDLIFALKTGAGYSPSIPDDPDDEDRNPVIEPDPELDDEAPPSSSTEHYAMRRIKIGDTHL